LPKIVPDIHNKILSVAESHFKNRGFDKTDMREIAAEANLAVGTIYLHYQNKETLYLNVISRSWKNTCGRIEEISHNEIDPEEKLKEVVLELAQDMTQRKSLNGLWMEIGSIHHHQMSGNLTNNHFSGMRDPISKDITLMLREIADKNQVQVNDQKLDQLGSFVFIMTVDICMQDQEKASDNASLILDLIKTYLTTSKK
jgi:AcrR family transcriptional regulator